MAYTTIDHLDTLGLAAGEIEKGAGFFKPGHSFFYIEDINKVLEQAQDEPISNLQIVNITFHRDDQEGNHDRHEVTGLALKRTALGPNGEKWHNNVALAWPPYYKRASTESLKDTNPVDADYLNMPFQGADNYNPGQILHNE